MAESKSEAFKRILPELLARLQEWFEKAIQPIDGVIPATDDSILQMAPAIGSKQVLDTSEIIESLLGFKLPPSFIKPGGYRDLASMLADIIPKVEQIYVIGLSTRAINRAGAA